MKVLMICTEKLPVPPVRGGAIQTYIEGITPMLAKNHNLTVLGISDPSLPGEETKNQVHYVRVDGDGSLESYIEHVVNYLKNHSFDLIHIFNRPRLVMPVRQFASNARLILSMHNDMFGPNKIHPEEGAAAVEQVERIVTVSDYVGKTICQMFPKAGQKLKTIYSGVDLKHFYPYYESQSARERRQQLRKEHHLESRQVILFVGRLSSKKGADILIRAMPALSRHQSDVALVLVGGSWYSQNKISDYIAYIQALAAKSPVPIITTGYIPHDQIRHWFWAGDVFVCASQWEEPLARVHYEAMASGLPIVTTARGGNPEVISGNGLIVENPENPEEFSDKLHTLISTKNQGQRMGQIGRKLVEQRYGWDRVAQEILDVWRA